MEETCISSGFESTDLCFGCGHIKRMANKKKSDVEKDTFLQKPRAKRNLCIQPWHKKFKNSSIKNSAIRDKLIKKYASLSNDGLNNLNVVVKNFNRKKVTSGKQTYEVNCLTVSQINFANSGI